MLRRAIITSCTLIALPAFAADPPQLQAHEYFQNVVRLPDGKLWRLASRFLAVYHSVSTDNGLTWQGDFTAPWKLFDTGGGLNPIPTVGLDGSLHLFQVRSDGANGLDLYHIQSNPQLTSWSSAEFIHNGRIGSMLKAITTSTGRLIAPFGDSSIPPPSGYGNNKTYVQYRDVGSTSFTTSPDTLISPVPSTWNGASDGACEPTVIEKNDGSLWMLMRSQTGKLTQSTSTDAGEHWTAATNSNFYTTSGPPCLVRMDNGDMVLFWNNATMPPKYNNKIWYAGRDVLHAAISQDDGQTWKGFREIYLDPYRNEDPPTGDTGTAYPVASPTNDDRIILITGQAAAKAQFRIDPLWLLEKNRSDDFSSNTLDDWSVFKPIGDVVSVKRARVQGAVLIDDPDPQRTKPVLHVRRPDTNDPDGAAWNFPAAARGTTSVRMQLQSGFAGGEIALTDHFFNPTDTQGETNAFYRLGLPADGVLPGGVQLQAGQWYDLSLDWKTDSRKAVLRVDGQQVAVVDAQSGINVWPGLSYLRFRSTAAMVDNAGFLIDSVSHNAIGLRDAQRMTSVDADSALVGGPGWTTLRFDDFVPNTNSTTSGNGITGTFASPYTGLLSAAGAVLESSTGTLVFSDNTSTQLTSDILGPKTGETLTLRLQFSKDPEFAATVSQVALRLGSVAANNVSVKALDAAGNELPDWDFGFLPLATNGVVGWQGQDDLASKSLIHSIQFTTATTDTWLIGSFALANSLNDLALRDLRVAGSHWACSTGGSWDTTANWDDAIPNSPSAVACFTDAMSSAGTVTLASPVVLNKLLFDATASHTLAGNQPLTLTGAGARLSVTQGSHRIETNLSLASNTGVNVVGGSTLTITGSIAGSGVSLSKLGNGALFVGKVSAQLLDVQQGRLTIAPDGSANGAAVVNALNVATSAMLDLTDNAIVIDYTGVDPSASIRAAIISGRNGGQWNGNGIASSLAGGTSGMGVGYANASDLGISTFLSSIPVDDTALLLRATILGDATLDGRVNTLDFNHLSGGFGQASPAWVDGDFDYDGDVDSVDFNQLLSSYGRTLAPTLGIVVPEPTALGVMILASGLVLRRIRSHRARR